MCKSRGILVDQCTKTRISGKMSTRKMKIITTTINPAFDMHYEDFMPYKENYVNSILISAGGKGINVSRTLKCNNIKNTAYVVLGSENAEDFVSKLRQDGLDFKAIYCKGRIRENITIHTSGKSETRISLDSFALSEKVFDQLLRELFTVVDDQTILIFSGRLPRGISSDMAIRFLTKLRNRSGCRLVVDCNTFSLEELVLIKAWLIKPNEQEIEALIGEKINTIEQVINAAAKIAKAGIENVIVSMGKDGAVAVAGDSKYQLVVPDITPLSTVGAGDSMIAGFVGAYAQGACIEECLKSAALYGTSACLTQGTGSPTAIDMKNIKDSINVVKI